MGSACGTWPCVLAALLVLSMVACSSGGRNPGAGSGNEGGGGPGAPGDANAGQGDGAGDTGPVDDGSPGQDAGALGDASPADGGSACASPCNNGATCIDAVCACLPGYSGASCELPAVHPASGIACPASGRPADGWPLVFTFNGNCYRAVSATGLAADPVDELLTSGQACAVAIPYGDVHTGADIDALIRTTVVPLITGNRGLVNTQKIGAVGFSAGGTVAMYLGTEWARGVDPSDGTDNAFRVAAVANFYGPLRLDRTHATDGTGALTGGGGLLYLQETRATGVDVDIPNIRQWSATNCFCAARGTSPCTCEQASATYLAAYEDTGVCSFALDDAGLTSLSVTAYIDTAQPAHVAAMYLCSGWKDSNVDYDMNLHQAVSYWRPENLVTVRVDDGHGFPLSVCESTAGADGGALPLAWMVGKLSVFGDYPPL